MHLGLYKHFKGQSYRVIGTAIHTETGEVLVIYIAIYGEDKIYARPRTMFLESVEHKGATVPRFKFIEEGDY